LLSSSAWITRLRKHHQLTQPQLAALVGVHRMTVSNWERALSTPSAYQRKLLDILDAAPVRAPHLGNRLDEGDLKAALLLLVTPAVRTVQALCERVVNCSGDGTGHGDQPTTGPRDP